MWLLLRLQMSSRQKHLFLNVVELDEHTGSSYDGQLSSHTQRASNAEKALQMAWYSQVTFVHGSISLRKNTKSLLTTGIEPIFSLNSYQKSY